MVRARLPPSMVEAKCQGASRCVPLWVDISTRSTAQPSPSGSWSGVRPGKNAHTIGALCLWSM